MEEHFKLYVEPEDPVYQQKIMEEILRLRNMQGSDYIQPMTEATKEIQVGMSFSDSKEAEEFIAMLRNLAGVRAVKPEKIIPGIPEYKKY